ncbi:LOW QUALITY PROTEIN: hypothetical protein HID58_085363 [Brassica napus]|uniref:Uncharacterized protein n=1 Tax=Brassica napus TaxID=3708 RepID=A0ABQ7XME6_BRANA|nr:LOW QUALITY PROTEIN: hypothetical protein HID58_085363 [Brassica napus]
MYCASAVRDIICAFIRQRYTAASSGQKFQNSIISAYGELKMITKHMEADIEESLIGLDATEYASEMQLIAGYLVVSNVPAELLISQSVQFCKPSLTPRSTRPSRPDLGKKKLSNTRPSIASELLYWSFLKKRAGRTRPWTCKIFLESMAYIYFAAVIGKGAELKFPTNLLMSDIVAFFNNENFSVNGILFELLVKGETAQGMIKAKDLAKYMLFREKFTLTHFEGSSRIYFRLTLL